MSNQLPLPGFTAEPRLTDNLFFAIVPDEDAAVRIARLAEHLRSKHDLDGRPLAMDRLHVSLYHLGTYEGLPTRLVAAASEAAATVAMPPFDISFDQAVSFSGRPPNRPFVLRTSESNTALTTFWQALAKTMDKAALGRWARSTFTPHLTLLYGDRAIAEQPIEAVGWTVYEFVLVHSVLGQSRYNRLGRWRLQSRRNERNG